MPFQSCNICPAGGARIRGGHASSHGRSAIADHLALMYGRMQRVRELVAEVSFPPQYPQYGGSNSRKGTAVVRCGRSPCFGVAWERLLSARLLPFGQPALSAQLRRPSTLSATSPSRRNQSSWLKFNLTLRAPPSAECPPSVRRGEARGGEADRADAACWPSLAR